MPKTTTKQVPESGNTLFQHAYDWVNTCELTQLDAILLAMLVFFLGCGLIGLLLVMGHVQAAILEAQGKQQIIVQTVVSDTGPARLVGVPAAHQAPDSRFGQPRQETMNAGICAASVGQ